MEGRGGGWWPERSEEERDPAGDERGVRDDPGRGDGADPPPRGERSPREQDSRDRPRVASRYSLFVGLAFAALVLIAVVNALQTDEGGVTGAERDADRGVPLPEFALPEVPGPAPEDADANIAPDDCESSRNPCPADQVREPACEIETAGALRVCDLFSKPLAISFWFTRGGDCLASQDAFDGVARRRSEEVNFLSVNVLDDRERVEEIVAGRGWQVQVGHDTDGAVSNLTGVGVCPTVILAYPGGIIHSAEITPGNFTAAEIDGFVDDLVAASEERERR